MAPRKPGSLLSSAAAASTPGWLVPSWYSLNDTSRSRACQYTSAASAARSALASAGAAGMAICVGVMPARLTASGPMGLPSRRVPPSGIFSKSAGSPDWQASKRACHAACSTSPRALWGSARVSVPIRVG
jgi:hypothetical protein